MRIVYLTAGSGRRECDACLRDSELARALMRQGHDVLLLPLYTPLVDPRARRAAVPEIFYGGINVFLQQKFPLFRRTPRWVDRLFDAPWLLRFVARFGHMTEAQELAAMTIAVLEGRDGPQRKELDRLARWLATHAQPDVVVLANTLFAGMAPPLREALGAPVVAMLSGEDTFIEEFPEPHRAQARDVLARQTARLDGMIAGTDWYGDYMADYLNAPRRNIAVCEPGVPIQMYPENPKAPAGPFTLGYRTVIARANGLHRLADIFIDLRRRPATRDARLCVAGYLGPNERPYLEHVRRRLEAAGLGDAFEYAGELGPEERPAYLARVHALCVPTIYPEPVGMYAIEAAAAAVPFVAPDNGCMPEWATKTGGGLATPDDDRALADAIERLAAEPARAREIGLRGRRAIETGFTVEHMAERTLRVLETFL